MYVTGADGSGVVREENADLRKRKNLIREAKQKQFFNPFVLGEKTPVKEQAGC